MFGMVRIVSGTPTRQDFEHSNTAMGWNVNENPCLARILEECLAAPGAHFLRFRCQSGLLQAEGEAFQVRLEVRTGSQA